MTTKEKSKVDNISDENLAKIVAVQEGLIQIEKNKGALIKNEVGYIVHGEERLKGEILRVQGKRAEMQIFEDTSGVRVGDEVHMSGNLLSVKLGPGLLGSIFDGLQNPLNEIAEEFGYFLPRGPKVDPLALNKEWQFKASVEVGQKVSPGQALGQVTEAVIEHKILVPLHIEEAVEVTSIQSGSFTIDAVIARLTDSSGKVHEVTMQQEWPVRRPIPENMIKNGHLERLFPHEPLTTTTRIIDTFLPIARGGTACIPGPFGAGKTVLQSLISRYATVDVVIIVACGERAGEVVETITEFPETKDPRTGGTLMDRTVIICNTSAMPVAAREASIYTGITIAEYYRQMGLNALLIADSTSRWAQAMRETSGRMEEIPGEEAYPAYLDSSIKNVYERAGVIKNLDGETGSLTMIGTVSPAGGNFEEPVTQATLGTVKTFLGLSYDRAYKRFYPAIDPLISWSRYLDQLNDWFDENLKPGWSKDVKRMHELLIQGESVRQMMQVTGEEGVSIDDFIRFQKALFLDMVYLQQDAFDKIDVSVPRDRQVENFLFLIELIDREYKFKDKEEARIFFTQITGLYKNMNYEEMGSADYKRYHKDIEEKAKKVLVSPGMFELQLEHISPMDSFQKIAYKLRVQTL